MDSDDFDLAQDEYADEAEFLQAFEEEIVQGEDSGADLADASGEVSEFQIEAGDVHAHDLPAETETDPDASNEKMPDAGASIIEFSTEEAEDDRDF